MKRETRRIVFQDHYQKVCHQNELLIRQVLAKKRRIAELLRDRQMLVDDNVRMFSYSQLLDARRREAEDQRDQLHAALQAVNKMAANRLLLIVPEAFGVVGSTIRLRSGRYLDLLDPRPDQFTFLDIAGGLAKICRFGGQIDCYYSVAEHSYHCAHQAQLDRHSTEVQQAALLHDAAEAFIGDVVKPLKMILGEPYAEIERRMEGAISQKFNVDFAAHKATIREIDHAMLIHERLNLFSADNCEWVGQREVRKVDSRIVLHCWDATHSEGIFTQTARWLGIEVNQ